MNHLKKGRAGQPFVVPERAGEFNIFSPAASKEVFWMQTIG
jgi:hypothetical protein